MHIIPAIDLKDGKCVRLYKGEFSRVTTYDLNPLKVARNFAKDGAEYLNLIDLDGSKAKEPVNNEIITHLIKV